MNVKIKPSNKKIWILKKGAVSYTVKTEDIVFFESKNRLVQLITKTGERFLLHDTLNEIEECLELTQFFRASRRHIINILFIKSFKNHERVKIELELATSNKVFKIPISQYTAPKFRKWIEGVLK